MIDSHINFQSPGDFHHAMKATLLLTCDHESKDFYPSGKSIGDPQTKRCHSYRPHRLFCWSRLCLVLLVASHNQTMMLQVFREDFRELPFCWSRRTIKKLIHPTMICPRLDFLWRNLFLRNAQVLTNRVDDCVRSKLKSKPTKGHLKDFQISSG